MENKFVHLVCSLLFCSFTFLYLFFFQADTMTVIQHLASGGQTFYSPWLGAILITLTLKLLQVGINSLLRLKKRGFALTYLPSFLILTFITGLYPNNAGLLSFDYWVWLAPLVCIVLALLFYAFKRYEPYETEFRSFGPCSEQMWIALLILLIGMFFTTLFSNTDKSFHARARVEALIDKRDYAGALEEIKVIPQTDSALSMLTIYAVARQKQLPDSLFEYRLVGRGTVLRPGKVHSWLQPDSILYKTTRNSANYQLVGFLLDRNLNEFARYLPQYYPVDSLRPRYYAEAYNIFILKQKGLRPKGPYKKGSYAAYYFSKH